VAKSVIAAGLNDFKVLELLDSFLRPVLIPKVHVPIHQAKYFQSEAGGGFSAS